MAFQSLFSTTLAARVGATDTTFTLAAVPTITSGRVRIFNSTVSELCSFTGVAGSTITGVGRNLSLTAVPATAGGTGYVWPAGTKLEVVLMHDQIVDARVPVMPTFADTASRDAAIPSPSNGTLVYVTSVGQLMQYVSGNWQTVANGTDYATTRTATNATANNGEWYRDSANSFALTYKSNAGTSYAFVVDATGKIATTAYDFSADTAGTETTKPVNSSGVVAVATGSSLVKATNDEFVAATSNAKLCTPLVAGQKVQAPTVAATGGFVLTVVGAALTERSTGSTSFTKVKEMVAGFTGTHRITFEMRESGSGFNPRAQIYKNGVAFGTLQSSSGNTYVAKTEDLAFTAGDLIQLYIKIDVGATAYAKNLTASVCIVPNAFFAATNTD